MCKHIFVRRYRKKERWIKRAYDDYTKRRHTFGDLSDDYHKDHKTIRRKFDGYFPVTGEIIVPKEPVNLVLDATFFKRGDGYMVSRANGRNLHWFPVETEKVEHYERCIETLRTAQCVFKSFTIDGRRGVRTMLQERYPEIPIQHCQYHQIQTITQKLTQRPKLEAGKELRSITLTLTKTTRGEFTTALNAWHEQWGEFLKERTYSEDRRESGDTLMNDCAVPTSPYVETCHGSLPILIIRSSISPIPRTPVMGHSVIGKTR